MKIAPHVARVAFVLAMFAAGSAFNVAEGNHFILPCEPNCHEQVDVAIDQHHRQLVRSPQTAVLGWCCRAAAADVASWLCSGPAVVNLDRRAGSGRGHSGRAQGLQMAGAGARFPPADGQRPCEIWGTLTFTFGDCNRPRGMDVDGAGLSWKHGPRTALTLPAGLTCQTDDEPALK
jgi:hypothetical protein